MYKNLYKPGEYNLQGQYKIRSVFLPKKERLAQEQKEHKRDIKEKVEDLTEKIKGLEKEIKEKEEKLEILKKEADDIIQNARQEAKNIIEEAEKNAEEIKAQKEKIGYEEGFDKGYYDGLEKGKSEIENQYKDLISQLKYIVENIKNEKQKILKDSEEDIVKLAVAIAKKVVHQEISQDKEKIVSIVKEALKKIEDKEKIIIYVNPEDLDLIKKYREEFKNIIDIEELHIMPEEILKPGECKIESKSEIIDTDLDFQFDEIKKKLLKKE